VRRSDPEPSQPIVSQQICHGRRSPFAHARSAWRSGRDFAALYRKLVKSSPGLFSRSAGGGRVVESAQYWLQVGYPRYLNMQYCRADANMSGGNGRPVQHPSSR
jgi:hypothetical protein